LGARHRRVGNLLEKGGEEAKEKKTRGPGLGRSTIHKKRPPLKKVKRAGQGSSHGDSLQRGKVSRGLLKISTSQGEGQLFHLKGKKKYPRRDRAHGRAPRRGRAKMKRFLKKPNGGGGRKYFLISGERYLMAVKRSSSCKRVEK